MLYNSCSLPIQVMTTWPLRVPSKCKSGRFNAWGHTQLNAWDDPSDGYGYGLWCGFKLGPHHATSHLRSRLESQHQSVAGCAEACGDPLLQSGCQWQSLGFAAVLGAGPQVQRDQGLASEGVLGHCILLSLAPFSPELNPLDYMVWSYIQNITSITSHNTKVSLIAAIHQVFAELLPSSQFRIDAVIEAEGGYIEEMSALLHNQVTWIDFFNKSFKIKL